MTISGVRKLKTHPINIYKKIPTVMREPLADGDNIPSIAKTKKSYL